MRGNLYGGIALVLVLVFSQGQFALGQDICRPSFSEEASVTTEGGLTISGGVGFGIVGGRATLNLAVQTVLRVESDCVCVLTNQSTAPPRALCGCPQEHSVLLVGTLVSDLEVIDEFGFKVQTLQDVQSSFVLSAGERMNIMPRLNTPECRSIIDQEIRSLSSSLSVSVGLRVGKVKIAGVKTSSTGFKATARCFGCETRQPGDVIEPDPTPANNPCLQPVSVSAPRTVYLDAKGFAQFTVTATDPSGVDDIRFLSAAFVDSVSGVGSGMTQIKTINETTLSKTIFVAFDYKQLKPGEITGRDIELATFKSFAGDSCGDSTRITTTLVFLDTRSHRPQLALEGIFSLPDGIKEYRYNISDVDPNEGFAVSVSKLVSFDNCTASARTEVEARTPETIGQVFVSIGPGPDAKRCGFWLIVVDQQGNRASDTITFLAVGDFNQDSNQDVAFTMQQGAPVRVLTDAVNRDLSIKAKVPCQGAPLFVADLDGSGQQELVTSTVGFPTLCIAWNAGGLR